MSEFEHLSIPERLRQKRLLLQRIKENRQELKKHVADTPEAIAVEQQLNVNQERLKDLTRLLRKTDPKRCQSTS